MGRVGKRGSKYAQTHQPVQLECSASGDVLAAVAQLVGVQASGGPHSNAADHVSLLSRRLIRTNEVAGRKTKVDCEKDEDVKD
jgi:hypothetical protein